jgi:hypothetical protein
MDRKKPEAAPSLELKLKATSVAQKEPETETIFNIRNRCQRA